MCCADAIAITGYTIFINIAVTGGGGSDGWAIAHGPLSIVFGILAGMGASLIAAPTKLWNNAYKRTCVILILGESLTLLMSRTWLTNGPSSLMGF